MTKTSNKPTFMSPPAKRTPTMMKKFLPRVPCTSKYFFLHTPWMHTSIRFSTFSALSEWVDDFKPLYDLMNEEEDKMTLDDALAARAMWKKLTKKYGQTEPHHGKMPLYVGRVMRRILHFHKLEIPEVCRLPDE